MSDAAPQNILASIPEQLPAELFEKLAGDGVVRIERIISHGHRTPEGAWYDQPQAEFVLVICGAARLLFESRVDEVALNRGDYLLIAPHERHRVEWTTPDTPTIWLAVHF